MKSVYTAIIQQSDSWWIGWVEEIAGVNSQGESREELIEKPAFSLAGSLGNEPARCAGGNFRPI